MINIKHLDFSDNMLNDLTSEYIIKGLKSANLQVLKMPIEKGILGIEQIKFDNNNISRKQLFSLQNNFLLHFCNNISV